MRFTRLLTHLAVPFLFAILVACGGSDSPSQPSDPGDDDGDDGSQNPSITLTVSPTSITITQSQSGEITVTITRSGGFSGEVNVSASNLPDGVSAEDVTISSGSTEATMTVEASETAAVGSATATVEASGSGVSSVSQQLEVEVEEAQQQTDVVSVAFCEASGVPDWVAVKDGDGGWSRVEAAAGQSYELEFTSDRVGLAYTTAGAGSARTTIFYFSAAELSTFGESQCAGPEGGNLKTVNGSVADLGMNQQAFVSLGGASTTVGTIGGGQSSFTLEGVRDGPQDLVAGRVSVDFETGTFSQDRLVIRRGLDPADGATLDAIDFGAEGFGPATAEVTVEGIGADESVFLTGFFVTGRGTLGQYFTPFSLDMDEVQTYTGIPEQHRESGDIHYLQAFVTSEDQANAGEGRMAIDMFAEVENRTMTVGPRVTMPEFSSSTAGEALLIQGQYAVQAEYDNFWSINYSQAQADGSTVSIAATDGWLGGGDEVDLSTPDFSGVSGWQTEWGLDGGADVTWMFSAMGWTGTGGIIQPGFQAGGSMRAGLTSGEITP